MPVHANVVQCDKKKGEIAGTAISHCEWTGFLLVTLLE